MTHLTSHLTDDQIDDQLIGDLSANACAHLAACEHCQARVAEAEAPLANFRSVSLAWAERRSATLPLLPATKPSRATQRLAWATAAVAALAIGVAIPVLHHPAPQRSVAQVAAPIATAPEQIAQDNQMLQAIDRELTASSETPADLGLQPVSAPAHARTHTSAVRD